MGPRRNWNAGRELLAQYDLLHTVAAAARLEFRHAEANGAASGSNLTASGKSRQMDMASIRNTTCFSALADSRRREDRESMERANA